MTEGNGKTPGQPPPQTLGGLLDLHYAERKELAEEHRAQLGIILARQNIERTTAFNRSRPRQSIARAAAKLWAQHRDELNRTFQRQREEADLLEKQHWTQIAPCRPHSFPLPATPPTP